MENAYDLTWKHDILMDIHEAGIKWRMFKFIQNFLKPRSFKVKVNEILSDTKVQTEGIPQGSVVSLTFFILKINKIVTKLPNDNRLKISLYMDDLQMSCCHPDWKVVQTKLQDSINFVEKFVQMSGFKFSTSKTSMLHFTKQSILPPIELRLGNIRIQKSETVKYLGLMFGSKLDWKPHIQQLKSECNEALNFIRSVSHSTTN